MKKLTIFVCIMALFLLILGGCGNTASDYDYSGDSESYSKKSVDESISGEIENNVVQDTNRKIIYTVSYKLYTEDMEKTKAGLSTKLKELGGYVSSSSESESYGNYVYHVPTEKLDEFLDYVDGNGEVGSKQISTEDVTTSYSLVESRISVLTASKAAYEKLLADENLSLSEIIEIKEKIEEIDTELQHYENVKDNYDAEIDYAEVDIYVAMKSTYKEPTFFDDYFEYLGEFFTGLGKFILYSLPIAIVGFGIFAAIFFPLRAKSVKDSKKNN